MPKTQKYRVDTDQGSYDVEVEVPEPNISFAPASDSPTVAAAKGFVDAGTRGLQGFVGGIVPGVGMGLKALATTPIFLLKEAAAAIGGASHLVDDPVGVLTQAYESLKAVPGQAADAVKSALDLASQDPHTFGQAVGALTAGTELGIATSRALPIAPKPVARQVGSLMETVGKKGAWPLRIMGAHQLGSGNVVGGLASMAAPELLQRGGSALTRFGAETAPVAAPRLIKAGTDTPVPLPIRMTTAPVLPTPPTGAIGAVVQGVEKRVGKIASTSPAAQGLASVDEAIGTETTSAKAIREASRRSHGSASKAEMQADAQWQATEVDNATNQANLDRIAASRDGLEAGPASHTTTVAATDAQGGKQSMTTRFAPPADAVPSVEDDIATQIRQWGGDPSKIVSIGEKGGNRGGIRLVSPNPSASPVGTPATAAAVAPPPMRIAPSADLNKLMGTPAPVARAYTPETGYQAPTGPVSNPATGPHIGPANLVLSPEDAAAEVQLTRAYKPGAQLQGMTNAARQNVERLMDAKGLSEMEKVLMRQQLGIK